jgi:hypothetical protein
VGKDRKLKMKTIKRLIGLLTVALMIGVTVSASAEDVAPENDTTTLGTLPPHKTKVKVVNLIEGTNTLTVVSNDDDALFTCRFYNENGFSGLEQVKVPNCSGTVTLKSPMSVQLEVTNESDKTLDYRINLHRSPPVEKKTKAKGKHK